MACADAEERAEVAFELLDVDGDGLLGKEDIRQALSLCGYEAEAGTLELLAAGAPKPGQPPGQMDSKTFQVLVKQHSREVHTWKRDVHAQAVTAFGDDEFLDAAAVVEGLKALGLDATEDEASEMMRDFDQDRDGLLSQDEFQEMLGTV
ncbi:CTN [Symbiodinium sp. CCMP2592]|nr:CTN [Symbiodinium sp. CCMP2592]